MQAAISGWEVWQALRALLDLLAHGMQVRPARHLQPDRKRSGRQPPLQRWRLRCCRLTWSKWVCLLAAGASEAAT